MRKTTALKKYIKDDRYAVAFFAKKMGISKQVFYKWADGASAPNVRHAIELERLTSGAVSVYSWK